MREIIFLNEDAITRRINALKKQLAQATDEK
jgi:hypothetical protein